MPPKKALWIAAGCLLAFQLFIRYDHWRLDDGRRAEYDMLTGKTVVLEKGQRRNLVQWLTGASPRKRSAKTDEDNTDQSIQEDDDPGMAMSGIAEIPSRKSTFKERWTDEAAEIQPAKQPSSEPDAMKPVKPSPVTPTRRVVTRTEQSPSEKTASKAVPTPDDGEDQLAKAPAPRPVERQKPRIAVNDLNQDGAGEQIIQSMPARSGIIDFSIVDQGREVFYGKGYQLRVLTTRHQGWSDLAVVKPNDTVDVFRYNPSEGVYQMAAKP